MKKENNSLIATAIPFRKAKKIRKVNGKKSKLLHLTPQAIKAINIIAVNEGTCFKRFVETILEGYSKVKQVKKK